MLALEFGILKFGILALAFGIWNFKFWNLALAFGICNFGI